MKITLFIILFFSIVLCGCNDSIKVTKTYPIKIDLLYNINQVGSFTTSQLITSSDLSSRLHRFDVSFLYGKIDKIDLQSIAVGANVEGANTAQTIQIEALVDSDGGKKVLLNKSKVIQIESSRGGDLLNALGAAVGVDKNKITLRNAIDLINSTGVKDFEGKIENMIRGSIVNGIKVDLNGTVPANQRLIMNLNIQISLVITHSTCEKWVTLFPFSCNL